ncbi:hypothetical protein BDV25DRAFT_136244 [Aspergillus avenaceus]|uniref:SSCRP protein n=1 Tax=Aspergillus avenaceus TaxID=36643 RepID=A0A5N6U674_ASPAV|nr:hypothetical protein BDV25DRAFT_136244 [Aspergillus avenaceus]
MQLTNLLPFVLPLVGAAFGAEAASLPTFYSKPEYEGYSLQAPMGECVNTTPDPLVRVASALVPTDVVCELYSHNGCVGSAACNISASVSDFEGSACVEAGGVRAVYCF